MSAVLRTSPENKLEELEDLSDYSLRDLRDHYIQKRDDLEKKASKDRSEWATYKPTALLYLYSRTFQEPKRSMVKERLNELNNIESCNLTIEFLDNLLMQRLINPESADMAALGSDGPIDNDVKYENLVDVAGETHHQVSAGNTVNSQQGQRGLLSVDDFFSRPVKLYENTLALNTDINIRLSVWDLYSLVPSVRAKMRNYAFIRGDLNVRVAVSGTPFHYGRLLLSPQPYAAYNATLQQYITADGINSLFHPLFLNYLSQAAGSVTLDVKENAPVEVKFPFISTKPMHRLFGTQQTVIAAGTSLPDFETAGDLYIYSLNQIKAVTATPSTVYIQVYAWLDNVELGTNTGTQLAITTESASMDERVRGPVETFASSAVDVSNTLSSIPVIAPLAKASSIVFTALRGLASLFGWSKPTIISSPVIVKNEPFQNGAMLIGHETTKRLVLDPRQELTVDPRCTGTSDDEMTIKEIASRRSFLQTFAWNDNSPTLSSPLWTCRIAPTLVTSCSIGAIRYSQPTAMAYAAAPFTFWRGDIIFRFEVICSAFHRGKIAVYFEPNQNQMALIDATVALNKQYIRVIDIQDTQIFEVRVNWATYRAWLKVQLHNNAYLNNVTPSSTTDSTGFINGYISVVPFTRLQSPDNSDISVNVYVMSDNLQLNGTSTQNMPVNRKILTESATMPSSTFSKSCNAPQEVSCIDLNESTATTQTICHEHFGEQPLSFRALLKRYVTQAVQTTDASSDLLGRWVYPCMPPNTMTYGDTSTTPSRYNHLLSYLRYAYLGVRGGIRYRVFMTRQNNPSPLTNVRVTLLPASSSGSPLFSFVTENTYAPIEGSISAIPNTMGGIEFEVPFYSNNLFSYSFKDDLTVNDRDIMEPTWFKTFKIEYNNSNNEVQGYMLLDVATGEDFNMMRFCGAPMYSYG